MGAKSTGREEDCSSWVHGQDRGIAYGLQSTTNSQSVVRQNHLHRNAGSGGSRIPRDLLFMHTSSLEERRHCGLPMYHDARRTIRGIRKGRGFHSEIHLPWWTSAIHQLVEKISKGSEGTLVVEKIENIGGHYAKTLR